MTVDFKCYPSPQQTTGVFILNRAMYAVIVCGVVLLFFILSAQLLLFSCSDQRISIFRLVSRLLFHFPHFAFLFFLTLLSMHSLIITSPQMMLFLYSCFSSFQCFSPLISWSHVLHLSFIFTTHITVFPSSLLLSRTITSASHCSVSLLISC